QKGTVFSVIYNYGSSLEQTKMDVTPANQKLTFTIGTGPAIQPNSVELKIPLQSSEGIAGSVTLTDVPVNATRGNLVNSGGQVQCTIIYATGAVEVTPISTASRFVQTFTTIATYAAA